jgi:NADPH-dependent ferric siderophore reductase
MNCTISSAPRPTIICAVLHDASGETACAISSAPLRHRGRTLTIDFAIHLAGPHQWAAAAKVGDRLDIGGPRGSAVVPDDFDWYLLIGDEARCPPSAAGSRNCARGFR